LAVKYIIRIYLLLEANFSLASQVAGH